MRILILADAIDRQYAGVYVYAYSLIKNLLKIDRENEYWFVHLRENNFFKGLNEIILPQSKILGMATCRKFFQLPKLIRKLSPDIVLELEHLAPWVIRNLKAKKIVTIYDLTPVLFKKFHVFYGWFLQTLFFPRLFERSDGFLAISECTKKDVERLYQPSVPIEVTYLASRFNLKDLNPANNKKFHAKYKNIFPYILYVGTLEPRKNLELLIEVFNYLKKNKDIPHKLVLVGNGGWKYKKILQKIEASDFKSSILKMDYVDTRELSYFYYNAGVLAYPSLYEGFGLPVLEAMSLRCPVVVSNTSSLPEVVGDAGVLCDPNSVEQWANSIYSILANNNLKEDLAKKGLERSNLFSWENSARKTLDFFKKVTKSYEKD